jgi:hypothetical protein
MRNILSFFIILHLLILPKKLTHFWGSVSNELHISGELASEISDANSNLNRHFNFP